MAVSVATAMLLGAVFAGDSVWTAIAVLAVAGGWSALALAGRAPLPGGGTVLLGLVLAIAAWSGLSVAWSVAPDLSWAEVNRTLVFAGFLGVGLLLGAAGPDRVPLGGRGARDRARRCRSLGARGQGDPCALPGRRSRCAASRSDRLLERARARGRHPPRTRSALAADAGQPRWSPRVGGVVLGYAAIVAVLLAASRAGVAAAVLGVGLWLWLRRDRVEACAARARGRVVPGGLRRRLGLHPARTRRGRLAARRSRRRRSVVRAAAPRRRRARGPRRLRARAPLALGASRVARLGRALAGSGDRRRRSPAAIVAAPQRRTGRRRVRRRRGRRTIPTGSSSLSSNNRSAWWREAWRHLRGRPAQGRRRQHLRGRAQALPRDRVGGVPAAQCSAPVPGRDGTRRARSVPRARRRRRRSRRSALSGGSTGSSGMRRPPWRSRWRCGSSMRSSTTTGTSSRSPARRSSPPAFSPQPGGPLGVRRGLLAAAGAAALALAADRVGRDAVARRAGAVGR